MFRKIFQVSADKGMGINKVNVLSFQLKNVSKFLIAWLAREKQNILTPQQCFSHANTPLGQSEREYYLSYFINANN